MVIISSDSSRSDKTRDKILDTAELLFMQQGFDGASLRDLTTQAGVNLAAVNYHFGSKEVLLQEVLRRRLSWLNAERLRLLDAAEAKAEGKPLKPSLILDFYFGTLLRMGENPALGGQTFLQLIGRVLTEPADFIRNFLASEYSDVLQRYKNALFLALPDAPPAEIAWRLHFMLGAMSYAIAGIDSLQLVTDWQVKEDRRTAHDRLQARLMSFLLGGLRAPLPDFATSIVSPIKNTASSKKTISTKLSSPRKSL